MCQMPFPALWSFSSSVKRQSISSRFLRDVAYARLIAVVSQHLSLLNQSQSITASNSGDDLTRYAAAVGNRCIWLLHRSPTTLASASVSCEKELLCCILLQRPFEKVNNEILKNYA